MELSVEEGEGRYNAATTTMPEVVIRESAKPGCIELADRRWTMTAGITSISCCNPRSTFPR